MTNKIIPSCVVSSVCLALASAVITGCERSESASGVSWNEAVKAASASQNSAQNTPAPAANQKQTAASSSSSSSSSSSGQATVANYTPTSGINQKINIQPVSGGGGASDGVSYGSLRWTYGGVNGSGAVQSGVSISGLSMGKNSLSFTYNRNLSAWGYSNGDASALACFFVQKSDGSWVGGKFDWISSSRTSRDLSHTRNYNGWNLSGVPNPCKCAFVIVDKGLKKRSNVLVGTWSR